MICNPYDFRPRREMCVVSTSPRKGVSSGGILLPVETHAEKLGQGIGTVAAVSETCARTKSLGLKVGDLVVYRDFLKVANPLEVDSKVHGDQRFFVLHINDILGVSDGTADIGVLSGRPVTHANPQKESD